MLSIIDRDSLDDDFLVVNQCLRRILSCRVVLRPAVVVLGRFEMVN